MIVTWKYLIGVEQVFWYAYIMNTDAMIMYCTCYAVIQFITSGIYQYSNNAMIQNLQINIHTTQ